MGSKRVEVRKQIAIEMTWENEVYHVMAFVVSGLFTSMVLGLSWLRESRIIVDCDLNKLYRKNHVDEALYGEKENITEPVRKCGRDKVRVRALSVKRNPNIVEVLRKQKWGKIINDI